jgi:hypothetical protein
MSDSAPDQEPKPQPKFGGGPPKPPKITARSVEDGSPKNPDPIINLVTTTREARQLVELLESIRGSRLHALNMLESDLDVYVVRLSKLIKQLGPEERKSTLWYLQTICDYRRKHPRSETGDKEVREQAKKILDELVSNSHTLGRIDTI